jgi:hypothetical protein
MRTNLDVVERRYRSLAMNKANPVKIRRAAIGAMRFPSDQYLCRLLKACRGTPSLELVVTGMLAGIRDKALHDKLRTSKPSSSALKENK